MMKPILHNVMAGIFLVLFLAACEDRGASPPAPQAESNLVKESGDVEKEFILLEALRQAEALEQPDSAFAAALHDVGELYRVRGDLAAAEPYFWRALPVWAASVGAMDPHMAITLSSLALLFEARKEYAKAVPLVEQALKVREMAFGVEHPRIVPSLEQYAGLLRLLNRHEEAERIEARLALIPVP
ncbi:MAG: tetratricopeptide repeat protein [Nitrospira sp. SB0662_bin_26]|nr:tetratricopeptide repeat protein [Nitrospira sp. SB0662_bin_26]